MSKAYPSNLTRVQYEFLSEMIPEPKPGGRKREVDIWEVLNGIFYVLVEGVRWRSLPGDFPAWQTVYTYFRNWRKDGTWLEIHDTLRQWTRIEQERHSSPSEAIIDSQSVKTAAMVHKAVGYDAGKKIKGRKRFMTVDTLGLVLRVLVTAASVGEREGGKKVLKRVKQSSNQVSRLTTIWVDGGFNGDPFMQWVMDFCRWIVQVVLRPEQTKGFVLLKKRWVVERTFGWLMGCRRLVRDYELLPETSETFIYLAMIRIMVRRLA
ncbi:Transposase (plasmid) [Nostoc flagelliforme CCNUN1]|uniref:Transposase n=1 Tax=Nostoc flagelliforme CCNUN1 TaxID=2038116 RepID=A0A2K8ST15_9NOSO|nr:IS5 family transposase [Nostoc flagelliforme]AUB34214.1 Transposase [Nostoc flagelliforme CCNUN1]AUB35168.1 Transposase [Nostoc flagelliforme CCNUN1]AUB35177.1 Transposase [Nostoc flagelliforme CCNUN1]AUB35754.1 Transposase [Nostoc flagelliforme CCNUN1]AUB35927.1 Transposase [Nostoc flagelliforme CCNUN1]